MLAYLQMENYEATLAAGRKALRLSPDSLHVLATLANVIPHGVPPGVTDDARLDEAEGYARQLLRRLPEQKIPRSLAQDEWKRIRLRLEVSAHAAVGLVSLRRAEPKLAIRELEWVTTRSPEADGVQFLRLGSAYAMAKDYCAASRAFERALALGPEPVRRRAQEGKQNLTPMLSGCGSER
jgi:tetratricopeptide (TPR) repeat protein